MTDFDTADTTTTQGTKMDNDQMLERIHALEVTQAAQAASMAGAEATQTAMNAGNMATTTAMTTGTVMAVAAGGISLVVGMFLGLALRK